MVVRQRREEPALSVAKGREGREGLAEISATFPSLRCTQGRLFPSFPSFSSLQEMLLDLPLERCLRYRANHGVDVLPVLEEENAGNRADVESHGSPLVGVYVNLGD